MKSKVIFLIAIIIISISSKCEDDNAMDNDCTEKIGDQYLIYDYLNEGIPNISSAPKEESNNISYGVSNAADNGNNVVEIRIPGIRVRTNESNFEITTIKIDEKSPNDCFVNQDEFSTGSTSFKTDILSVLVLDMSTSLTNIINELKSYAKEYANTVVTSSNNSQVAVIFFSSRNAIQSTQFFNSTNINQLNTEIDNFVNYQDRTALYEATEMGITLLDNQVFDGEKSLVVFTDGGDNDSNNPSQLVQEINSSSVNRFAIGLRGNDFRENNLQSIVPTNSNLVIAENSEDLQSVFRKVGRGVISVYELVYNRSNQLLSSNEAIEIRISMETVPIQ